MNTEKIKNIISEFQLKKHIYTIWIIANVSDTVQSKEDYIHHADFSEFFTKAEFASISSAIANIFGYVRIFYSELEFIKYIVNNKNNFDDERILVYNFARDGVKEGKKSLIPAFCDLFGINYIGSNPFVISLLRNKYIYTKFLENENVPVPKTFRYNESIDQDLSKLESLKSIIIKNTFESASIGMDENNVIKAHPQFTLLEQIKSHCSKIESSDLLIQEFVDGMECEVFVVEYLKKYYAFPPVKININNSNIITYSISNVYDYTFSPLANDMCEDICQKIMFSAEKAANALNISDYARFDFRVTSNGNFYLIDIAGSPYLTRHSSVEFLFTQILQLEYSDIFALLAALSEANHPHAVNCKSDKRSPLEK